MAKPLDKELAPEVLLMVKEAARDLHYKLIESGALANETPGENSQNRTYLVEQFVKATQTILKFNS